MTHLAILANRQPPGRLPEILQGPLRSGRRDAGLLEQIQIVDNDGEIGPQREPHQAAVETVTVQHRFVIVAGGEPELVLHVQKGAPGGELGHPLAHPHHVGCGAPGEHHQQLVVVASGNALQLHQQVRIPAVEVVHQILVGLHPQAGVEQSQPQVDPVVGRGLEGSGRVEPHPQQHGDGQDPGSEEKALSSQGHPVGGEVKQVSVACHSNPGEGTCPDGAGLSHVASPTVGATLVVARFSRLPGHPRIGRPQGTPLRSRMDSGGDSGALTYMLPWIS